MSNNSKARVKQKVYIVLEFPSDHGRTDQGHIVAVYGQHDAAVQKMIRLEKSDSKHKNSYHIVRKSVQGSELAYCSDISYQNDPAIVFLHRGN